MNKEITEREKLTISPELAFDKNLSLKAKGVYLVIAELTFQRMDFKSGYTSITEIAEKCKDGFYSVQGAVNQLIEQGWLERKQERRCDGTMDHTLYRIKQ